MSKYALSALYCTYNIYVGLYIVISCGCVRWWVYVGRPSRPMFISNISMIESRPMGTLDNTRPVCSQHPVNFQVSSVKQ